MHCCFYNQYWRPESPFFNFSGLQPFLFIRVFDFPNKGASAGGGAGLGKVTFGVTSHGGRSRPQCPRPQRSSATLLRNARPQRSSATL